MLLTSSDLFSLSDKALVARIGNYIREERLSQNFTQQELAIRSGVSRAIIAGFEGGRQVNLLTLIQLLRALNRLEALEYLQPLTAVRPMMVAEYEQKKRKRASKSVRLPGLPGSAFDEP